MWLSCDSSSTLMHTVRNRSKSSLPCSRQRERNQVSSACNTCTHTWMYKLTCTLYSYILYVHVHVWSCYGLVHECTCNKLLCVCVCVCTCLPDVGSTGEASNLSFEMTEADLWVDCHIVNVLVCSVYMYVTNVNKATHDPTIEAGTAVCGLGSMALDTVL